MEENIIDDVINRGFDLSADTVYGYLVTLLVLGVIYALRIIAKKDKKLYELNNDTVKVLTSIQHSLNNFKEQQGRLGKEVDSLKAEISVFLKTLKK